MAGIHVDVAGDGDDNGHAATDALFGDWSSYFDLCCEFGL